MDGDFKGVVICLHGLRSNAVFFEEFVSKLNDIGFKGVSLQAPILPISLFKGREMTSWCDILSAQMDGPLDIDGIHRTLQRIDEAIDLELEAGFSINSIFLMGFSQGGLMVLSYLLNKSQPIGGAISFGTYLPDTISSLINNDLNYPDLNHKRHALVGHGSDDFIISTSFWQQSCQRLEKYGVETNTHLEQGMTHDFTDAAQNRVIDWVKDKLIGKDVDGIGSDCSLTAKIAITESA